MLATLPSLVGKPIDVAQRNDSKDGSKLFFEENAPLYRNYIVTQNNGGDISIRMGRWKYLPATKCSGAELYDLDNDPSELHNVVYAYPEVAYKLKKLAAKVKQ